MRIIIVAHFRLDGKKAFRQLPNLFKQAVYFTDEYKEYAELLKSKTKRLKYETNDFGIKDNIKLRG